MGQLKEKGAETKASKQKIRKLAVSGGASQSDEICRIAANIFNLPIVRGHTIETSSLGAAIITAKGLGIYNSTKEAVNNMVHYKKVFKPEKHYVEIYEKLYKKVYRKMYGALEPLYHEIREITGYPE